MSKLLVLCLFFSISAWASNPIGKVTCGMDRSEITKLYGKPNSEMMCQDGLYDAIRYNRVWIVLKGDGAFYMIDQKDFHGPCLANQVPHGKALCE